MSIHGYWMMGAVPPGVLNTLCEDIDATEFEPAGDNADLEWWSAMDHVALVGHSTAPRDREEYREAAESFMWKIDSLRPEHEAIDRCIDALCETVEDIHFVEGARSVDPFTALCYGLTFDAARRLPGRAGCFLLSETEVAPTLATTGPVLEDPPGGRDAYAERADAWLEVITHTAEVNTLNLLDGPLRVLRRATETGSAVIAVTHWY